MLGCAKRCNTFGDEKIQEAKLYIDVQACFSRGDRTRFSKRAGMLKQTNKKVSLT